MNSSENRVFLALGSNLGDREAHLRQALRALQAAATGPLKISRVYETPPMGPGPQSPYLNQCVAFTSRLTPQELLVHCRETEIRLGRVDRERWAPREIDLDILLFGDRILDEAGLRIPHPGLTQRQFVLVPLAEIDDQLIIPGTDATVAQCLERAIAEQGREDIKPYGSEAGIPARAPESLRYLCVEGVIGAGKSTLVKMLSQRVGIPALYEDFENNPFLSGFYQDKQRYAFQTQIFFLLSRHRQIRENFEQQNLFAGQIISDYMFAKDKIFAALNLDENELALYQKMWNLLEKDTPRPDFVIYLQADTKTLMQRIKQRDRTYERNISEAYIETLNQTYNNYFHHYQDSPLLIVNTNRIDFVKNPADLDLLEREITKFPGGVTYFSPDLK